MTDLQDTTQRTNLKGDPCPDWCVTNHDKVLVEAKDGRAAVMWDVHTGPRRRTGTVAAATLLQRIDGRLRVQASAWGGTSTVDQHEADELAKFIEGMAGMTRDQILELAAAVRQAAVDDQPVTGRDVLLSALADDASEKTAESAWPCCSCCVAGLENVNGVRSPCGTLHDEPCEHCQEIS